MKWVKFTISADKFRLLSRKYKEIFKYFEIFGYKNIQNRKYLHIFSITIGITLSTIYKYLQIFADTRIHYYIYIFRYSKMQVSAYAETHIYTYPNIRVHRNRNIQIFEY